MVSFQQAAQLFVATAATLVAAQTDIPDPADLAALTTAWETTQHASTDWSFYQTPSNFSGDLAPGSILKIEYATNLTNYTVPSGLSMSRIVYTTVDIHGSVLPASAYILWPYNALPDNDTEGYPVAAWAHGTTGLFQPCAPSNYRSLQYHFMVPYLLATQGMVVVAPDYAGLGVDSLPNGQRIRHPWATGPAQANDIAYALTAARAAFPQYLSEGGPFVTLGHSEGGAAAWAFAERQAVTPVPGYRGTTAFSPAGDVVALIEQAHENPTSYWSYSAMVLQLLLIDSITNSFPFYNRSGYTDVTSDLFYNVYEPSQGCLPTQNVVFAGVAPSDLAKPGWTEDPTVQRWQNLTKLGRKEFAGPLLILQGGVDSIIPYNQSISSSILSTVQDTCKAMDEEGWTASLELVGYPGMDHFPVIQASQGRWLTWVKDRLSGISPAPTSGCAIGEAGGFRTAYTAHSGPAPNFLVEWVNSTYQWEYSL